MEPHEASKIIYEFFEITQTKIKPQLNNFIQQIQLESHKRSFLIGFLKHIKNNFEKEMKTSGGNLISKFVFLIETPEKIKKELQTFLSSL